MEAAKMIQPTDSLDSLSKLLREGRVAPDASLEDEEPTSPLLEIADAYAKANKINLAVGVYMRVLEGGPPHDQLRAQKAVTKIARMYQRDGKFQLAMDLFRKLGMA
jgi:MOSC domain-containing protein YiiM